MEQAEQAQQPTKTPISELAQKAREHYTELTKYPNDFNSVIPEAINIWEQHELERERQEQDEKQWQHYEQSRSPEST